MDEAVAAFGTRLAARARTVLDEDLLGMWFVGSVALGGYVPGESDVDVIAVTRRRVPHAGKDEIVDAILEETRSCPARGLEFTLYRADVVAEPPVGADFELNANGGPRMATAVHLDASTEPAFWYVIDRAVAHRRGVPIVGPAPSTVIADIDRRTLLRAMAQSMRWHHEHEGATLYSVLNASRAWRFAEEDVLGSKLDGAGWTRQRWDPGVVDAAVALRLGQPSALHPGDVQRLLAHVEAVLLRAATA